MGKRFCYTVPETGYVAGEGWRPSIVREGESGHNPLDYFWGEDFSSAQLAAKAQNEKLGLTPIDVLEILNSSMVGL